MDMFTFFICMVMSYGVPLFRVKTITRIYFHKVNFNIFNSFRASGDFCRLLITFANSLIQSRSDKTSADNSFSLFIFSYPSVKIRLDISRESSA